MRSPDRLTGGLVVGVDLKRLAQRAIAAIGRLAKAHRPCKVLIGNLFLSGGERRSLVSGMGAPRDDSGRCPLELAA